MDERGFLPVIQKDQWQSFSLSKVITNVEHRIISLHGQKTPPNIYDWSIPCLRFTLCFNRFLPHHKLNPPEQAPIISVILRSTGCSTPKTTLHRMNLLFSEINEKTRRIVWNGMFSKWWSLPIDSMCSPECTIPAISLWSSAKDRTENDDMLQEPKGQRFVSKMQKN